MAETFTISNGRHSVVQRTPERLNTEKAVPRHIIIKLKKKNQTQFSKEQRKEKIIMKVTYKKILTKLEMDFSR